MNKIIHCRTTAEIRQAKERYGKDGIKLTIWLVCSECNIVQRDEQKKVAIHGAIHCWDHYTEFLKGKLGREVSEEELQANTVQSDSAYNLFCYRNSGGHTPCP